MDDLKKTVVTTELPRFNLPGPETILKPTTEQELLVRVQRLEERVGSLEDTDIKIADIAKLSVTKDDVVVIRLSGDWDNSGNVHIISQVKKATGCKDVFVTSVDDEILVLKTPRTLTIDVTGVPDEVVERVEEVVGGMLKEQFRSMLSASTASDPEATEDNDRKIPPLPET